MMVMWPSVTEGHLLGSRDYDGKVTAEEVAAAAMYLKDTLGQENLQELISKLAKDEGMHTLMILVVHVL